MKKILFVLLILLFCIYINTFSQTQTFVLDLAEMSPGNAKTFEVSENCDFHLILLNTIPGKEYIFHYRYFNDTILPFSSNINRDKSLIEDTTNCDKLFKSLKDSIKFFETIEDEKGIKTSKINLEKALKNIELNKCDMSDISHSKIINSVLELLSKTKMDLTYLFNLKKGQKLEFTITRSDKNLNWVYIFDAGNRGNWLTSYGITFISNVLKQRKEFIAKSINSDTNVISVSSPSRSEFDFAPSIFFTWMPADNELRNWSCGFCGGLGLDIDVQSPLLMFGFALTYNQNLNLILGISGRVISKPSDSYSEFQKIVAVDVDKLNKKTAVFDPFIAFTFRFGSNPFSK